MMAVKYSEILKLNKELGGKLKSRPYRITVLSNIIVQQSKEIFEYQQTLKDDANRHILYPDNWDNSYNIGVGRVPNRNKVIFLMVYLKILY